MVKSITSSQEDSEESISLVSGNAVISLGRYCCIRCGKVKQEADMRFPLIGSERKPVCFWLVECDSDEARKQLAYTQARMNED